MVKHIVIGGGSGFVGRALSAALKARGDRVTVISRSKERGDMTWDELQSKGLPPCDVVINLAGKHILDMRRIWNAAYRDELLRSRVETTQALVASINQMARAPELFISVAGKCFYGSQAYQRAESYFDLDERCGPVGLDYPAELVSLWEAAAAGVRTDVRHVRIRLGITLANHPAQHGVADADRAGAYGVFPLLRAVFQKGLAFSMGTGVQPFPWIHVDDVVGIFLQAIDDAAMQGIYNAVAPGIVSNREFTEHLAERLGRPVLGAVPSWLIKAVVGRQRSTILLLGQRVRPTRTVEAGYQFRHAELGTCLDDLVGAQVQS